MKYSFSITVTNNVGNYESVRIQHGIEDESRPDEADDHLYERVEMEVYKRLRVSMDIVRRKYGISSQGEQ